MKRISFILVLLLSTWALHAQDVYTSSGRPQRRAASSRDEKKGFDPDRLVFGGGLSATFGDVTNVGISPVIGYRITDKFSAGIGIGYQYTRYKNFLVNPSTYQYENLKINIFTPSVWARYLVFDNFFVHGEYEQNFVSYNDYRNSTSTPGAVEGYTAHLSVPAAPVGVGYRQPITDRSSLLMMALYDVLQNDYSPYGKQVFFRFGFNVGF
jgi:hypothetical protein